MTGDLQRFVDAQDPVYATVIAELRAGRMVILVDEEDRENEGDLVLAAEFVTPEAINFMARFGRGLICLTLTEERCHQLNLPLRQLDHLVRGHVLGQRDHHDARVLPLRKHRCGITAQSIQDRRRMFRGTRHDDGIGDNVIRISDDHIPVSVAANRVDR